MGRKAAGNLWKEEKVITCSVDKVEYSFEIWGRELSEISHHYVLFLILRFSVYMKGSLDLDRVSYC